MIFKKRESDYEKLVRIDKEMKELENILSFVQGTIKEFQSEESKTLKSLEHLKSEYNNITQGKF